MSLRILVVEDEDAIREMLCFILQQHRFETLAAENASQAQGYLDNDLPDLILLDWMLPGSSGLQFLKQIKYQHKTKNIPVMMLTAKSEEDDRVQGLNLGADDYISKPFSPKELIARINAVLRRTNPLSIADVIEVCGLTLDAIAHRVCCGNQDIPLGPTEFKLLHFFMSRPDRVFSRDQLLNQIWGDQTYVEDRTVDVHIRRLRKALEQTGHERLIQTVRGAGYRFSEK